MARKPTPEEIAEIQRYLPSIAGDSFDWDEDKISDVLLEKNMSVPQTVREFWLARVTETFEFVDVNESGSGRPLSQIHKNAVDMLTYWDKQVDAEGIVTQRRSVSFGVIESA